MSDQWPAVVPRDYNELYKTYGDYIAYLCQRYGRSDQSPQDLLQHIWEKLLKADLLRKYVASLQMQTTVPDTVSTADACALLGIGFGTWRSAQWSYRKIFLEVLSGKAPEGGKNRGITRERNARGERWVLWMPSPVPPKGAPEGTKVASPYWTSAHYVTKQVISLAEMGYFRGVCVSLPTPTATTAHFKNYLRQAVKNHFANYVRTKKRRHKERPADCFAQFRGYEDGSGEEMTMETRIEDPHATGRMEAMADLVKFLGKAETAELLRNMDKLLALLHNGTTLREAIVKLKLSEATRRAVETALLDVEEDDVPWEDEDDE